MTHFFSDTFREFGASGVASLAITIFLGLMLKWILEQFKHELEENRKERVTYIGALNGIQKEMSDHGVRAAEFQKDVCKSHEKTAQTLDGIVLTLGRINGYKHD